MVFSLHSVLNNIITPSRAYPSSEDLIGAPHFLVPNFPPLTPCFLPLATSLSCAQTIQLCLDTRKHIKLFPHQYHSSLLYPNCNNDKLVTPIIGLGEAWVTFPTSSHAEKVEGNYIGGDPKPSCSSRIGLALRNAKVVLKGMLTSCLR